jgi:hypothetical protein
MSRAIGKYAWVLALMVLALTGCGGGGGQDSSSVATTTLTKKQYAKRAQAYCHRGYLREARAVEAFAKRRGIEHQQPSQAERERLHAAVVIPFVRKKLEYLRGLPAPEGDENQIRAILASIEHGIRETEAHPEWLAAPTPAHPEPFERTRDLTAAYGFWLCGQA